MSRREIFEDQRVSEERRGIEANYRILQGAAAGACAALSILNLINNKLETAIVFATAAVLTYVGLEKFKPRI